MKPDQLPPFTSILILVVVVSGCSKSENDASARPSIAGTLGESPSDLPPLPDGEPWNGPPVPERDLGSAGSGAELGGKVELQGPAAEDAMRPIGSPNLGADQLTKRDSERAPIAPDIMIGSNNEPLTYPLDAPKPQPDASTGELKAGLSPDELLDFMATADKDMRTVVTGGADIEDPQEARSLLLRMVRMKNEAATRLAENPDLDRATRNIGRRGQLQSLSHLASLGDLQAAESLRELAETNLSADDPQLVSDSQLVLVGFAIEDLQNGVENSDQLIVEQISELARSTSQTDVPAMMVMGQARQLLSDYGHTVESGKVRAIIIKQFADSPDSNIAKMAARLAGKVQVDKVDQLLTEILSGDSEIGNMQWSAAVEDLLDESADLQTVQYLSGAALELETNGQNELAFAVYQLMGEAFTDPDSATYREVETATKSSLRRRELIGQVVSLDLPAIDGSQLDVSNDRGKVIMMPFWTFNFPDSLSLVDEMLELQTQFPSQLSIVGINLDKDSAQAQQFASKTQIPFPSFRTVNPTTPEPINETAVKFGVVSMPFVVIVNKQGEVDSFALNPTQLIEKTQKLLTATAQ